MKKKKNVCQRERICMYVYVCEVERDTRERVSLLRRNSLVTIPFFRVDSYSVYRSIGITRVFNIAGVSVVRFLLHCVECLEREREREIQSV